MIPPSSLVFPLLEEHPCWSKCARRTRPFSGRAFREHRTYVGVLPIILSWGLCEQEGPSGHSLLLSPNSPISLHEGGLFDLPLRAAFSPAHPLARRDVPLAQARGFQSSLPLVKGVARLPFTARIERAQFHRARSASKKGTWPLPSSSFGGRALREHRR
jgi:hypothetical protein